MLDVDDTFDRGPRSRQTGRGVRPAPGFAASTRCWPPCPPRPRRRSSRPQRLEREPATPPAARSGGRRRGRTLPGGRGSQSSAWSDWTGHDGRGPVHVALAGAAAVSVTVRMNSRIRAAIVSLAEESRTPIEYTNAVFDEGSGAWISRAEVTDDRPPPAPLLPNARPTTSRVGGWCGGFRTSTPSSNRAAGQEHAVRHLGGSTPSSPPPTRCDSNTIAGLGQGTRPRRRDHRTGRCRPQGSPRWRTCLGGIHCERRLAGAGRDRVQPHQGFVRPDRYRPGRATTATVRRKLIQLSARSASRGRCLILHPPARAAICRPRGCDLVEPAPPTDDPHAVS